MTARRTTVAMDSPSHDGRGGSQRCVWMTGGVLSYWLCQRDFHCESCPLDQVLSGGDPHPADGKAGGRAALAAADDVLHPVAHGALRWLKVPLRRRRGIHYHPDHVWAREQTPGRLRLGLDDIGARLTEEAEGWSLPAPGQRISSGDPLGRAVVAGRSVHVTTPLPGRVVARNVALATHPILAVWSPYDAGWLIELETEAPLSVVTGFLSDEPVVVGWFEAEIARLADAAPEQPDDPTLGPTMADGGQPALTLSEALGRAALVQALARTFPVAGQTQRR